MNTHASAPRTRTLGAMMIVSACAPLLLPAQARAAVDFHDDATRRVALVIGHHDGGAGRETLVYAGSDASAFRRTLEELGGLQAGDAILLFDPDSAGVSRALDDMEERARALKRAGRRVEAIVYYSGHADDKGFRLGAEGFAYRAFRSRLDTMGADVRIAVVDACESGALTRLKGGRPAPSFLIDQSIRSEGYAILTSSSENEAAQESDRLGGSFFTHALNTGLRGAADASRDGKVTLHEAYQFAFNETLARTQATRGGPQHAGYEIRLTGSGDVVLTDLREASTTLELPGDLHGRLFIRDSLGHLIAELNKPAGSDMQLGLAPGTYDVRLQQGATWSVATVTLIEGKSALLGATLFASAGVAAVPIPPAPDTGFHHVPQDAPGGFSSALLYDWVKSEWRGVQLAPVGTGSRTHLRGGQLSLGFNSAGGDLEGFQASIGANIGAGGLHGMQFSSGANIVGRDIRGAQFATGVNIVGRNVTGVQASVGLNTAGEALEGWQATVGGNIAGTSVRGGQASVGANIAGDSVRGAQITVGFNIAGDSVQGGQVAVGFNIAGARLRGGQASVGFNLAGGDVNGGQGTVGFNLAGGTLRGGQGAVGLNIAGDVHGGQGAVGANLAFGSLLGFQLGFVNIAGKVKGAQIGLVNLSDDYESGAAFGLLNISRKGSLHFESWVEESGMAFAGIRTSAGWMRSHLAVGTKPVAPWTQGPATLAPTLGMSTQFPVGPAWLDGEAGLLYSTVFRIDDPNGGGFEADAWTRARAGFVLKPFRHLWLTSGLSYNVAAHDGDAPLAGKGSFLSRTYSGDVSVWPGLYAGIRIGK